MLGLGRRFSPDSRDTNYPMRALIPPVVRYWRYWSMSGAWLDQGNTGTCVGHAWAHYTEDGPTTHPGTVDPIAIYREACLLDEWPENDQHELDFGTSVRAGAQALQARGIISEYRWAYDVDTITDAVLTTGPVVVGTNWYADMLNIDPRGFLHPTGSLVGGHAYVINGANRTKGTLRVKNSWGRSWGWGGEGRQGYAFISMEDMDRLISEDGEACLATERPMNGADL